MDLTECELEMMNWVRFHSHILTFCNHPDQSSSESFLDVAI